MILAILQARVSSSRLPRKVLMDIEGSPMILRQLERVFRSNLIDHLVVATSTDKSDDELVYFLKEKKIDFFRGSLNNVLDRFYFSAKAYNPEHIVRLTGDCPLADFSVIDDVINAHIKGNFDYTSNTIKPTFPDGLDVEVFTYSSLKKAYLSAKLPSDREHVTPYIYNNPDKFKVMNFVNNEDMSLLRWTVDEPEDFKFVTEIYRHLYNKNNNFSTLDVLLTLKKYPNLMKINSQFKRNEGLVASIEKDKEA